MNQAAFRRAVAEVEPDVVYLWNLSHVSPSIAFMAEAEELNVCYRGTYWHEWHNDPWWGLWNRRSSSSLRQLLKWPLQQLAGLLTCIPRGELQLEHIHFALEIQKRITLRADQPVIRPVDQGRVAGPLFPLDSYPPGPVRFPPRKLLFVGNIVPRKGLETATRALAALPSEMTLTVVGAPTDPAYGEEMRRLAEECGVSERVDWRGGLPHDEIAPIYRDHDIFLFPSHWETLGYVIAEAMASGTVVVGTAPGGSAELMRHDENALVFEPGDAEECARLVKMLLNDEELFMRLRRNAREMVERDFSLEPTIDRIEAHLYEAADLTPDKDRS
ncbi:MAG: glycosyltransferase family 4 protein [Armatimonadota bacterium]